MIKQIIRRFMIFVLVGMLSWQQSALAQLPEVPSSGMFEPEGEYITERLQEDHGDGYNRYDFAQDVATDLIPSGGSFIFQLDAEAGHEAAQYVIQTALISAAQSYEVYLNFLQVWRYETGLRAPEDLRLLTGMMLDEAVDLEWIQILCQYLHHREGWESIYPSPFVSDAELELKSFTTNNSSAVVLSASGAVIPTWTAGFAREVAKFTTWAAEIRKTYLFERFVVHSAWAGFMEASHGIPARSTFLDFRYSSNFGYKVHGPDGVFVTADGECHLLEMKWSKRGGTLGRIRGYVNGQRWEIVQGSPGWFQKAMLEVCQQRPEDFIAIRSKLGNTNMGKLLDAISALHNNLEDIIREEVRLLGGLNPPPILAEEVRNRIINFADADQIYRIYKNRLKLTVDCLDAIGEFWAEDFYFSVVNKTGLSPRRIERVGEALGVYAKAFGKTVQSSYQKVRYGSYRRVDESVIIKG